MCKVYTGYCGTSQIEHGLCACTVDNLLAKARGLSLRTGAQTLLNVSLEQQYFMISTNTPLISTNTLYIFCIYHGPHGALHYYISLNISIMCCNIYNDNEISFYMKQSTFDLLKSKFITSYISK